MRRANTIVVLGLIGGALLLLSWGCSDEPEQTEETVPRLRFQVVDSLLQPKIELTDLDLYFRPPQGFTSPPDSLGRELREQFAGRRWELGEMALLHLFIHQNKPAGIVISRVGNASLDEDTTRLFAMYRDILRRGEASSTVREGEYRVNDVFVKNFLVTDSLNVRFQLLCLSDHFHGAEFIYYAGRQTYPHLVKGIESSIGSIERIHKGGTQ